MTGTEAVSAARCPKSIRTPNVVLMTVLLITQTYHSYTHTGLCGQSNKSQGCAFPAPVCSSPATWLVQFLLALESGEVNLKIQCAPHLPNVNFVCRYFSRKRQKKVP